MMGLVREAAQVPPIYVEARARPPRRLGIMSRDVREQE